MKKKYRFSLDKYQNIKEAIFEGTDIKKHINNMRPETSVSEPMSHSCPAILQWRDQIRECLERTEIHPIVSYQDSKREDSQIFYGVRKLHKNFQLRQSDILKSPVPDNFLSNPLLAKDFWWGFQKHLHSHLGEFRQAWEQGEESVFKFAEQWGLGDSHDAHSPEFHLNFKTLISGIIASYSDEFSFDYRDLKEEFSFLTPLFASVPRTVNRCSFASLLAKNYQPHLNDFLWHRDESVFLSTRLLFPIFTSENFSYEMYHHDLESITSYQLTPGFVYSWDTEGLHRMLAHRPSPEERVSLLLGVTPWFDYDPKACEWVSNDYYGKKHPLDMFCDGDLIHLT